MKTPPVPQRLLYGVTGAGAVRPPLRAEAVHYLSGRESRLLFDGAVGSGGAVVRHLRVSKRLPSRSLTYVFFHT